MYDHVNRARSLPYLGLIGSRGLAGLGLLLQGRHFDVKVGGRKEEGRGGRPEPKCWKNVRRGATGLWDGGGGVVGGRYTITMVFYDL